MALDAERLGIDNTIQALKKLLIERFDVGGANISENDPLFSIGLGLSSLDGIEFLCETERLFDIRIKDLEWWTYDTPTLANVAQHVIELSRQQHSARAI